MTCSFKSWGRREACVDLACGNYFCTQEVRRWQIKVLQRAFFSLPLPTTATILAMALISGVLGMSFWGLQVGL